jgi:methylmalonyl-CoA mutase N-terminal domain/subunit
MAQGEVGKVGVAIDSLADMETCFDGIPLDKVSTSMTINATCGAVAAGVVHRGGGEAGRADGEAVGDDPERHLKEYIARGTYIFRRSRRCA